MASKVVSQRIQNTIKSDIGRLLNDSAEYASYSFNEETGNIEIDGYEVIMCVIPRQSINHSEVRNG